MTRPWTNQAVAPSNLRDRPFSDTVAVLHDLGVPQCAQVPLAGKLYAGEGGQPLFMGNTAVFSIDQTYDPTHMPMSFTRDGVDSVTTVHMALLEPDVAEVYTHYCDHHDVAVAYMPKCGNAASLQKLTQQSESTPYLGYYKHPNQREWHSGYENGNTTTKEAVELPVSSSLSMLLLGMITIMIIRKIRIIKAQR